MNRLARVVALLALLGGVMLSTGVGRAAALRTPHARVWSRTRLWRGPGQTSTSLPAVQTAGFAAGGQGKRGKAKKAAIRRYVQQQKQKQQQQQRQQQATALEAQRGGDGDFDIEINDLKITTDWKPEDGFPDEGAVFKAPGDEDMDIRIRQAQLDESTGRVSLDKRVWKQAVDGGQTDGAWGATYTLEVDKLNCAGCGARFHADSPANPGFLPPNVLEKLEEKLAREEAEAAAAAAAADGPPDEEEDAAEEWEVDEHAADSIFGEVSQADPDSFTAIEVDEVDLHEFGIHDAVFDADGLEIIDDESNEAELEVPAEKPTFCQRCHRLRHYGQIDDALRPGWSRNETLMPAHFRRLIDAVRKKRCVVLTLVDVFDFHGSILPDIKQLAGRNPVIVAVNKADLLPKGYSENRVRAWIRQECAHFVGLHDLDGPNIHLVSAKSGFGVGKLLDTAREMAIERKCDVYVVGAANVGKSSLLNRLCNAEGGFADSQGKKGGGGRKGGRPPKRAGITTSSLPGTTLSFLKLSVGNGVTLVDTPGLILPHQLTVLLNPSELKEVVPQRRIDHTTLRVGEGKTVLLGGLARVAVLEGRPFFLTFFVADDVKLHPTDSTRTDIDGFVRHHAGKLLTPPASADRVDEIGELDEHDFIIHGDGWNQASCDLVLSGLGWVSFTGVGELRVRVSVPRGVMVLQRDPLMPKEARDTMAKATGGRVVKTKARKQGGRRK